MNTNLHAFLENIARDMAQLPDDYSEKMNKKYLFAFLDHLGFSNKVLEATEDEYSWVSFIADMGIMIEECLENQLHLISAKLNKNIEWKFFSDSLCIYTEIGNYETGEEIYTADDLENIFRFFVYIIGNIQLAASIHGTLYRGGISVGRFYDEGNVTVSDALVRAHIIESTVKIPAVGIDDEVWNLFANRNFRSELCEQGFLKQEKMLIVDFMNLINENINETAYKFRQMYFHNMEKTLTSNWSCTKTEIENGRMTGKQISSVVKKYKWLANYYVEKCSKYGIEFSDIMGIVEEIDDYPLPVQ